MLKRIISIVLSALLLLSLCSCNDSGIDNSSDNNSMTNSNTTDKNSQTENSISPQKVISTLFPTYKSARQIYAVDISEFDENTVVFLRQLQGLVAKTDTASVYLVSNENERDWLDYLCNELGSYSTEITAEQMVALYGDSIKTIVVYSAENNEFSFAWNDAIRRDNAVCVDYSVANAFNLFEYREVIDVCGIFNDEKSAYEAIFQMVDDINDRTFVSLSADSSFIDYAYACSAFMLPVCVDEWSYDFVKGILSDCMGDMPGVIYTDNAVDKDILSFFSTYGYGNIPVSDFSNSTTLSSISVDYRFEKVKVQNSAGKKGNIYLSLIIDCLNAGDILNDSYAVCKAKRTDYCVAFEYPMFMSRLAPATLLRYTVNTMQSGDSVIPDGNWLNIDQNSMPDELYVIWQQVNNLFIKNCGMSLSVTDQLREDANPNYLESVSADGVMYYSDASLSGEYTGSDKPVLFAEKMIDLYDFEGSLENLSIDKNTPLFFIYSITPEHYFSKIPIYDVHSGYYGDREPDGYYTITEIVAVFIGQHSNSIHFISPAQSIAHIKKISKQAPAKQKQMPV